MPAADIHQLRVAEVIRETHDAYSLIFDVPPGFAYQPGQFLTLRIPHGAGTLARCYSLASSPHDGGAPKVTVKRVADGRASNWICDNVMAGSIMDILPPSGVFTPRSFDGDLLLFAGGSGITPVISIGKSALSQGTGQVMLVYANRDERSVIFRDELNALAQAHPERLVVIHWLESVQGLPTTRQLQRLAAPFTGRAAFVCGPGPFMRAVEEALGELGVPRERIHVERFISLSGDPFTATSTDTAEVADDCVSVEVELDGDTHTYPWPRSTPLLDLLLAKGLDAPYSCREGACSACACRVTDGEVKMLRNEVLEESDLAEGYVLACQAVPLSETVKVSYS
ncbi:MAG: 2Fe-2S iron-sulfur cluster-binding protein [Haloechinothrix sp.]